MSPSVKRINAEVQSLISLHNHPQITYMYIDTPHYTLMVIVPTAYRFSRVVGSPQSVLWDFSLSVYIHIFTIYHWGFPLACLHHPITLSGLKVLTRQINSWYWHRQDEIKHENHSKLITMSQDKPSNNKSSKNTSTTASSSVPF
jgi:hypothetical protein